jgi:hypothetical protein
MTKKGGSIVEGLWVGTAFFAAKNARTFSGFLGTFLMYSVLLVIGFMAFAWVIGTVTGREMFTMTEIKCEKGSTRVDKCPGTETPGCLLPSGNCTASLSS